MSKKSVKYLQGIFFANETEIKNFVTATPDSGTFQPSSMKIQPYVRKFQPAIYIKQTGGITVLKETLF